MANSGTPSRHDLRILITAFAAGLAGMAVAWIAFVVPLYRHIVSGAPPVPASSLIGTLGLFAAFVSVATLLGYFKTKEPTDRGPRGGHRIVHAVSLDASGRPAADLTLERDRRAA
jgi:Na+/melibiose symporter-like transporter